MNTLPLAAPHIALQPVPESHPFTAKYIPLPPDSPSVLGRVSRHALPTNGWFEFHPSASAPETCPVAERHAEIWSVSNRVYIQDLASPGGTYVNETYIKRPTALKSGDVIRLGLHTSDHAKPIIAKVTLFGTS